jgi:hypothetical protein
VLSLLIAKAAQLSMSASHSLPSFFCFCEIGPSVTLPASIIPYPNPKTDPSQSAQELAAVAPRTLDQLIDKLAALCDAEQNPKIQTKNAFDSVAQWFKGIHPKPRTPSFDSKTPDLMPLSQAFSSPLLHPGRK